MPLLVCLYYLLNPQASTSKLRFEVFQTFLVTHQKVLGQHTDSVWSVEILTLILKDWFVSTNISNVLFLINMLKAATASNVTWPVSISPNLDLPYHKSRAVVHTTVELFYCIYLLCWFIQALVLKSTVKINS